MTRTQTRRLLAGAIALSAALVLAACGSDQPAGDGTEAAEEKQPNEQVFRAPNFDDPNARYEGMVADGCGSGFEDWATDAIVFFTDVNGGDWEYVDVSFEEGTASPRGNKTCDITIADAKITGTDGGDLNNATITVEGLPASENPYSKQASTEMFTNQEGLSTVDDVAGLSPLIDDGIDYATTNGLIDDYNINVTPKRKATAMTRFFDDSTAMAMRFDIANYGTDLEGEATDAYSGAWAAVSTDDPQQDSGKDARNAAGQLAQVFTTGISGMGSDSDYEIS